MKLVLCCLLMICANILGMRVIPERSNITYFNPKYLVYARTRVQRYSRRGDYVFHIEGQNKHEWNNNITIDVQFEEYLHNEFRPSFVRFQGKGCDFLNEPYIGSMFRAKGLECPAPAGDYHFMNLTVPFQNFPNVFPFEKGRTHVFVNHTETSEVIAIGYLVASYVQTDRKPKKKKPKRPQIYHDNEELSKTKTRIVKKK